MKNILNTTAVQSFNARQCESLVFVAQEDVANKNILDIGCGFGWSMLAFLDRGAAKTVGIEITEADLEAARKSISHKNASFVSGSAIKLSFDSEEFNTIVSWEVIEHIPKATETIMFKEAYRVLKPGWVFYLSTPFDASLSKIFDPAWWLIGHRHYSKERLAGCAQAQGFDIVETRIRGRMWTLLHMDNMYVAKWLFRREPFLHDFFSSKEKEEYKKQRYANIFMKFHKSGIMVGLCY